MTTFEIICDQLEEIQKGKKLGSGLTGTVYAYCNIDKTQCYAIKIIKNCNFNEIQQDLELNKKAYDLDLAFKIYYAKQCINSCFIFMDLVHGVSFHSIILPREETKFKYCQINYELFTLVVDNIIDAIETLHRNKIYHGDTNFPNIYISTNNKIKFIDFTSVEIEDQKRLYLFDYLWLLNYMPRYMEQLKLNYLTYFYDKVIKTILKHNEYYIFLDIYNKNIPYYERFEALRDKARQFLGIE